MHRRWASSTFDALALDPDDYADLLAAGSGHPYTGESLMALGRNVHQVQKAFNTLHAGFTRSDDRLPPRLKG